MFIANTLEFSNLLSWVLGGLSVGLGVSLSVFLLGLTFRYLIKLFL